MGKGKGTQGSNKSENTASDANELEEPAVNLSLLGQDQDDDIQSLLDKPNVTNQKDQQKYRIEGDSSFMFGNARQQAIW